MSKHVIEKAKLDLKPILNDLVEEATIIIDDYWLKWRLTNKQLKRRENQNPQVHLRGSIAPRITERTGKKYIEWNIYAPGRYGKREKSWGTRIPPRKGPVYKMSQFTNVAKDWELELIEQTENKLRPIRYAMERIHGSHAYLGRLIGTMKD